jgi:hypothetical protein
VETTTLCLVNKTGKVGNLHGLVEVLLRNGLVTEGFQFVRHNGGLKGFWIVKGSSSVNSLKCVEIESARQVNSQINSEGMQF